LKRLTGKEQWDIWYENLQGRAAKTKFRSEGLGKYFCHYSDYLLWDVILKKYMPKTKGSKVLEVGSAPGDFLVRLHEIYGFIPYGVEYSEYGVTQNRNIFDSHNINPDNVIHADFFDEKFQQKFRGYFDIVVSRGFIEHFTDVEDVIEKHLHVLAEGGCVIVSIPNLNRRSIYGVCSSLINKKRLQRHNLDIMSREAFAKLFNRKDLSALYCDYYGTLRLSLLGGSTKFFVRLALFACNKLQTALNPLFRLFLRDKGFESSYFSPSLLYIGLKGGKKDTV
jgi:SAM-dependent methyltransferase